MVLEDASSDDFGDTSAPPSDDDAYSSNSQPVAVQRYFWQSYNYPKYLIFNSLLNVEQLLERRLTQDEVNFTVIADKPLL